jgi:alpha-N-arabinofuranosidase
MINMAADQPKGTTIVTLDTEFQVGEVDPRIFGGFIEHLGRGIYGGIYDPSSGLTDENGFRQDVMSALRRLQVTAMRYPGGNFVSGYHWVDGIGPRSTRPTKFEMAWQTIEPNTFGTDEFMKLANLMGWAPMIAVNLGTGTPEEARNWVEYCNSPQGTKYADLRSKHAQTAPYGVKLWCLGNEMDGYWQCGHVPAQEYALRALQAAKMMKDTDSTIELVASGSSTNTMPTYIDWDRQVLEYLGDSADYLSLHRYVGNPSGDTTNYLGVATSIDQQIEEIDSVCRLVQAKSHSKKRYYLAFDEWNIWYRTCKTFWTAPKEFPRPINEEKYNLEDALVAAEFLNSFIRHANIVKIANLAQMVNVGAPVFIEGNRLYFQSIFFPFEMYSKRREGTSLWPVVRGPFYETNDYGPVQMIDASAILGERRLNLFLVNRRLQGSQRVDVKLHGQRFTGFDTAEVLTGPGPSAMNTVDQQEIINSQMFKAIKVSADQAIVELPPLSVAAITFKVDKNE